MKLAAGWFAYFAMFGTLFYSHTQLEVHYLVFDLIDRTFKFRSVTLYNWRVER